MIDSDALADLIAELIGDHVERATAPLLARIGELEQRAALQLGTDGVRAMIDKAVTALPPPPVPEAVTVEDLAPLVTETVERAVAALPVPKDGESVDPEAVRAMVDEAVAALPPPPAPEVPTMEDLAPLVAETVERAVAALPIPKDGESVDPEAVRAMVDEAVAALPPPPVPEAVTAEDLAPLVAETVERAVAALPIPKDGESVDPEAVRAMVDEAVAALPPPPAPGVPTMEDLAPLVAETVERAVAALPTPRDGVSVSIDDVRPLVDSAVERAVAALPVPKDGVGMAALFVNRDGEGVATLTDGSIHNLGPIVGRDADMLALERQLREMVEAIPKPRDAFTLDDFSVESTDDGRTVRLSFSAGGISKSFDLAFPVTIYRGVWREGEYKNGDAVTWAGSLWIAAEDTDAKPDTGASWKLAVKRGRDARPAQLQS